MARNTNMIGKISNKEIKIQFSRDGGYNKNKRPYVAKVKDNRHKKSKIFFDED